LVAWRVSVERATGGSGQMHPYDFSQIDFSEPEIAAGLARVYALLLERARCRRQQQKKPNSAVQVDVSPAIKTVEQTTTGHDVLPTYVQEDMFSGEVRDVK
jgi:hypothetical protein